MKRENQEMRTALDKMARFLDVIREHPQISVERLREQTGLSRSAVYRYIAAASSAEIPIRLERGMVINDAVRVELGDNSIM